MPPSERRNYTFDTEKDEVDGGDIRNGAHGHECEDGAEHHEKSEKYSDDIDRDGKVIVKAAFKHSDDAYVGKS